VQSDDHTAHENSVTVTRTEMMDRPRNSRRFPKMSSIPSFCLLSAVAIVALSRLAPADDKVNVEITGRVIDRETKQPIKCFRVVPGVRYGVSYVAWDPAASDSGFGGQYRIPFKLEGSACVVQIVADGYAPALSQEFVRGAGNVTFDFELEKGAEVDGIVAMPDGRPAAGAKVFAPVSGSLIKIVNERVVNESSFSCVSASDRSGHFHLPPQPSGFWLVITHASGYVIYQPLARANRRIISLDPWTRVEGTYRVNGRPVANVPLSILHPDQRSCWPCDLEIVSKQRTVTGPEGRFAFEFVMAGRGAIWRRSPSMNQNENYDLISCCVTDVKIPVATPLLVDIEEKGRSFVGKLRAPPGFKGEPAWKNASVEVQLTQSDERATPYSRVGVKSDGSFQTTDLPLGTYRLCFHFAEAGIGHLAPRKVLISMADIPQAGKPRDLGVLTLEKE
jgi:hypothetical protein